MDEQAGYRIPLDIHGFLQNGRFEAVPLNESITSNLHLLLITAYEEFDFDADYGCDLWEHEFSAQHISAVWVDRMAENIKRTIERYERRLLNVEVKVDMSQAEFAQKQDGQVARRLKRKLHVQLSARLASTNEAFRFEDSILLAPFSLD